jgi:hypothetical protein
MSDGFHLEQFVNPQSMITPGVAGTTTMAITNVLCEQFDLAANWTALGVSFLFGTVVFAYTAGFLSRTIYYAINSLFIFVMAHGSNTIGKKVEARVAEIAPAAITRQVHVDTLPLALASFGAASSPARSEAGAGEGKNPRVQYAQPKAKKKSKFFRDW